MNLRVLFICSRNQWRSPTAEAVFQKEPGLQVRSAGTAASARIRVTEKLVEWADVVFVMEKRHKEMLQERFSVTLKDKPLIVLHIPDEFGYMDPELVDFLKEGVQPYLHR